MDNSVMLLNSGSEVLIEDSPVITNGFFRADGTTDPMTLAFRIKDDGFVPMAVTNSWRNTAQLKLVVDAGEYAEAYGVSQKVTLVRRNSVETGGDFLAEIPPENITVFPKGSQIIQTSTEILIEIAYEPTVFLFR